MDVFTLFWRYFRLPFLFGFGYISRFSPPQESSNRHQNGNTYGGALVAFQFRSNEFIEQIGNASIVVLLSWGNSGLKHARFLFIWDGNFRSSSVSVTRPRYNFQSNVIKLMLLIKLATVWRDKRERERERERERGDTSVYIVVVGLIWIDQKPIVLIRNQRQVSHSLQSASLPMQFSLCSITFYHLWSIVNR